MGCQSNASELGLDSLGSQGQTGTPSDGHSYVAHVLEDINTVAWTGSDAPNAAYVDVLAILKQCPRHDSALLFAALAEIHPSPHYGFAVQFKDKDSVSYHGCAVIALVGSAVKSTVEACGDGYKVLTKNVTDVLTEAGVGATGNAVMTYDLVAYCSMGELLEFKLDPPRGHRARYALATMTSLEASKDSRSFVLDKLQIIDAFELDGVINAFRKLRKMCRSIVGSGETFDAKKRHAVPALLGPMPKALKSCRTLANVPTDATLPSPSAVE